MTQLKKYGRMVTMSNSVRNTKLQVLVAQAALHNRSANYLRYYLALQMLDVTGTGRIPWTVLKEEPMSKVATYSTIRNWVWRLDKAGLVSISKRKDWVYLTGVKKIPLTSKFNPSAIENQVSPNTWVGVSWKDVAGSVVTFRAFLVDLVRQAATDEDIPISRETLAELVGKAATTQRKYENITGTIHKRNYTVLGKNTEYNRVKYGLEGRPTFQVGKDLATPIPNSYRYMNPLVFYNRRNTLDDTGLRLRRTSAKVRVFYTKFSDAARAWERNPNQEVFWWSNGKNRWVLIPAIPTLLQ